MSGWRAWRRRRVDDETVDAELRDHLARQRDEYLRVGVPVDEARRRAHRDLGGLAQMKEACRDAQRTRWHEALAHDVRYAVRGLRRDRSFAVVSIGALALGLGVFTTQFAILNALCIRGLPIDQVDRIISISSQDAQQRESGVSARDFDEWRASTRAFQGLAAFSVGPFAVGDEGQAPERATGAFVSASLFAILRERPLRGRVFTEADDQPGPEAVAILGSGLWKRRYAADPALVGRQVRINGTPTTVIGVMGDGFTFPNKVDVWLPLARMPGLASAPRSARTLGVVGRLADRSTLAQATTELTTLADGLARAHPETNRDIRPRLMLINDRYNGRLWDPVWQAFITAGILVALIAAANVANLLLARSGRRARELAIRASLGASRARILRQLVVESALIALAGGLGGIAVSWAALRMLARLMPEGVLPYWVTLTMDTRGFMALAMMTAVSVCLFGLLPSVHAMRAGLQRVIGEGGRLSPARPTRRWTAAFLTAQVALTMVLLAQVASGAINVRAAERADGLIDPTPVLSAWVSLPASRYPSPEARTSFFRRLGERLDGVPGVSAWTWASTLPLIGGASRAVTVDGQVETPGSPPSLATVIAIGPRYFETLQVPLARGREFTDVDAAASDLPVIVNRAFAQQHFGDADPLGRQVTLAGEGGPTAAPVIGRIIGVSPAIRQRSQQSAEPVVYVPARWAAPATVAILLRAMDRPEPLTATLRTHLGALDTDVPLYRALPLTRAIHESRAIGRVSAWLLSTIASVALVLALVGLYAVSAYGVAQRRQEIGIRTALGASSRRTRWFVLRQAVWRVATGVGVGWIATWAWERPFGDPTAPLRSTDLLTFGPMAALLVVVALLACLVPAQRASRIDPAAIVRTE